MNKLNKLILLLTLLLAAAFILQACSCESKDDDGGPQEEDDDDVMDDDVEEVDDDIPDGWRAYRIDSEGCYSFIVVDSRSKVHISYCGSEGAMYATNKTGSWQTLGTDSENPDGWCYYSSIALDSNNGVHISYYEPWERLRYVTNKSGSWQIHIVQDGLTSGGDGNSSLALDPNGKAHIAFFVCGGMDEWEKGALKHATNKNGSWQIYTIDGRDISGMEAGRHTPPSIKVDSNGKVHVSYVKCSGCNDTKPAELWYATNWSGSWQIVEIGDDLLEVAYWRGNSLALGAGGETHVSFYGRDKNLCYVTNSSGMWQVFVIGSEGDVGTDNSIALDSDGYIHMSYRDHANDVLKYATNRSGAWETLEIDTALYVCGTSIAVDPDNYAHIVYSSEDYELRYATNRPPE